MTTKPSAAATTTSRDNVTHLIDELKVACRQPLFNQVRDFELAAKRRARRRLRQGWHHDHYHHQDDDDDDELTPQTLQKQQEQDQRRRRRRRRLRRDQSRPKMIKRLASSESGTGDGGDGDVVGTNKLDKMNDGRGDTKSDTSASVAQRDTNFTSDDNNRSNSGKSNSNNKRTRSEDGKSNNDDGVGDGDDDPNDSFDNEEDIRTWDTLVSDASELLPSMTNHEYGQVSKLVSILLLGYLLPQSTGNEFFMLQNISSARSQLEEEDNPRDEERGQSNRSKPFKGSEDMTEYILSMPLDERLECSVHRYDAGGYGELGDTIVFEPIEGAFQAFLQDGLRPFLRARTAHTRQVDLLHIIAMIIHPQPSEQCIKETAGRLEENKSEAWESTKRLMRSLSSHSFQVHYRHRLQMVKMVSNDLLLPTVAEVNQLQSRPLFEGALQHLRMSLYAFGMAALSPKDCHISNCGLVSSATQCGVQSVIREEWKRLLHRLVDDQTNYNSDHVQSFSSNDDVVMPSSPKSLDLHRLRGELLNEFLIRVCKSRHHAGSYFLEYALGSLTDAIEMQVEQWTVDVDQDDSNAPEGDDKDTKMNDSIKPVQATISQPPGILVSLFMVARTLFCFLLPLQESDREEKEDEESESEEGHRRDTLISCGIQLIHHWDERIVKEACSMLVVAFGYTDELWGDYVGAVFASVSLAIDSVIQLNSNMAAIEGLVATFSERSMVFAETVLELLLKKVDTAQQAKVIPIFRLVAAISTSCPSAAMSKREVIRGSLSKCNDGNAKKQLLAALLACRKSVFFVPKDQLTEMLKLVELHNLNQLDSYHLARHALQTGNPLVAKGLLEKLVECSSSRSSYLWFTALHHVASGEAFLATHGTLALANAAAAMKNASSSFQYLSSMADQSVFVGFQMRWLELRVSHLDLLRVIRQLSQEMRLTGLGPKKNTRPHIHLTNAIKLLDLLAKKYKGFVKEYGVIICQQSRSVIRTVQGHCSYLASLARVMFADSLANTDTAGTVQNSVVGDLSQPLTLFGMQLSDVVLKKIDSTVEGKVRAAAMNQILDGMVTVPFPIPKSLAVAKVMPKVDFSAVWSPSEQDGLDTGTIVDVSVFEPVKFNVSGEIPAALVSASAVPFNVVLIWLAVCPVGDRDNDSPVEPPQHATVAASMSPGGTFFCTVESEMLMKEGQKRVSISLGCRDIRGGEWELPTVSGVRHYFFNVVARG